MTEIEQELAAKGLRESIWLAIYFAQILKQSVIVDALLKIRNTLLLVETSKL